LRLRDRRTALLVAQVNAELAGELLHCLGEGEVFDLLHERDHVAAFLAAEAVVETLGRGDVERG
jgi:hypothetical protein